MYLCRRACSSSCNNWFSLCARLAFEFLPKIYININSHPETLKNQWKVVYIMESIQCWPSLLRPSCANLWAKIAAQGSSSDADKHSSFRVPLLPSLSGACHRICPPRLMMLTSQLEAEAHVAFLTIWYSAKTNLSNENKNNLTPRILYNRQDACIHSFRLYPHGQQPDNNLHHTIRPCSPHLPYTSVLFPHDHSALVMMTWIFFLQSLYKPLYQVSLLPSKPVHVQRSITTFCVVVWHSSPDKVSSPSPTPRSCPLQNPVRQLVPELD